MSPQQILGRFNYLTVRADVYNVLFFPFHGAVAAVIARNLDRETALALVEQLNGALSDAKDILSEAEMEEM